MFLILQNNSLANRQLIKYVHLHPNARVGLRFLLLLQKTAKIIKGHHSTLLHPRTAMGKDTANNLMSICSDTRALNIWEVSREPQIGF